MNEATKAMSAFNAALRRLKQLWVWLTTYKTRAIRQTPGTVFTHNRRMYAVQATGAITNCSKPRLTKSQRRYLKQLQKEHRQTMNRKRLGAAE